MDAAAAGRVGFRVYLRLGRVSNLPTVWTNVLAAVVLAGAAVSPASLALLGAAMSLLYVAGMYLNDVFDRHVDARERPERPIPAGLVTPARVATIAAGMMGLAVALVSAAATPEGRGGALVAALALVATIVYYDAHHKGNPVSPVVMGLCRVLVYVTVALATSGRLSGAILGGAFALLAYLIGLTYVAKQETLAAVENLWPLAFLAAPFVYLLPVATGAWPALALYAGFLGWTIMAVIMVARRRPGSIPRAVVRLIAGIALLDAVLIAGAGAPAMAMLAVAAFAVTLALQRWIAGT